MNRRLASGTAILLLAAAGLAGCATGKSGASTTTTTVPAALVYRTVAACDAGAKTVDIAVSALQAENPNWSALASHSWRAAVMGRVSGVVGRPFLIRWPVSAYYSISVAGPAAPRTTGDAIRPLNGDVIVTKTSSGRTYDATVDPQSACSTVLTVHG